MDKEVLDTGRSRFQFKQTPHVPHAWDAGLLFEQTHRTLFCSDLFTHTGEVEPLNQSGIVDRAKATLMAYQTRPFANYLPYTAQTKPILDDLAALQPHTLATMHGSSFQGDGRQALMDLATALREVLAPGREAP